jgi:hypothetical protein
MLGYSDVRDFVSAGLTAKDYGVNGGPAMPTFHPGPPTVQSLYKKSPNGIVFLTVGNGIGLTTEDTYDRPFIVVRILGRQSDYDYAETLAHDLDALFLAVQNQDLGSTRTLYVTRNAPPQLVDFDASDRYHFQTTYIAEAQR